MPFDLEKIGKLLKAKREEKGLTVAEISATLCIRKSLIEAMEQGNWKMLPHHVYVKGYIKEYANHLNVLSEITGDLVEEETKSVTEIPLQQKVKAVETSSRKTTAKVVVYSAIIIVLIGYLIVSRTQKDQLYTPVVESTGHISASVPYNAGSTEQKPPLTSSPGMKMLMISCQERTWISVIIDENEKKEFMLNPQEVIMLSAKEKFDLLIGNAGGIKMFLNGKDVQFSGMNGEVKRIKLS